MDLKYNKSIKLFSIHGAVLSKKLLRHVSHEWPALTCLDPNGREIARGLSSYSSDDLARIAGQATSEIQQMLGYSNGDEVIHRDDLVLLRDETTPETTP